MTSAPTSTIVRVYVEQGLRRTIRKFAGTVRFQAIVVGIFAVVSIGLSIGPGGKGAYHYGRQVAVGRATEVMAVFDQVLVAMTVYLLIVSTYRSIIKGTRFGAGTVFFSVRLDRRSHFLANLLYESLLLILIYGTGLIVPIIVFSIGVRAPLAAVSLFIGTFALLFTITMAGNLIGFCINYLLHRTGLSGRSAIFAWVLLIGGIEAAFLGREYLVSIFEWTPFVWFSDLLLASVPGVRVNPIKAGVALVIPFLLLVPAVALSRRLAEEVWYNSGPTFDFGDDTVDVAPTNSLLFRVGGLLFPEDVLTVCSLTIRNGLRNPISLSYALLPLFGILFIWIGAFSTEAAVVTLPGITVLLGAIAIGSLFTLNPLGADVAALPWLLTTRLSGKNYILGKIMAGLLLGFPLIGGLTLASLTFTSDTNLIAVSMTAVYALIAVGTAPTVAVGLGVAFPQVDRSTKIRGQRKTLPGRKALTAYLVVMFVGGIPGFTTVIVPLNEQLSSSLIEIATLAFVSAAILGTAGAMAYRYAVDSVDTYEIET